MKEITQSGNILARYIPSDEIKSGLNFYSKDEEFIQVGAWLYESGKELQAHIHNEVNRTINRTNEVLYIISGSLRADIYDLTEKFVTQLVLKQGDILILLECGHGYHILEDDTKVLEVKNGPYLGADVDRYRL